MLYTTACSEAIASRKSSTFSITVRFTLVECAYKNTYQLIPLLRHGLARFRFHSFVDVNQFVIEMLDCTLWQERVIR